MHHHPDARALTVLLEDSTAGLQVLHDGQWHDVAAARDRYSALFFYNPS